MAFTAAEGRGRLSRVLTLALWAVVAVLALVVGARSSTLLKSAAWNGLMDFVHLTPRIAIGVIGAGFIAELMPEEVIAAWLGPNSGFEPRCHFPTSSVA